MYFVKDKAIYRQHVSQNDLKIGLVRHFSSRHCCYSFLLKANEKRFNAFIYNKTYISEWVIQGNDNMIEGNKCALNAIAYENEGNTKNIGLIKFTFL